MNVTGKTLDSALETYGQYTETAQQSGSREKYLLLKYEDGSYGVAKKASKLTYLLQVLASLFGGSGPAYTAKQTDKNVLGKDVSDLRANADTLHTLSLPAQLACVALAEKLGTGRSRKSSTSDSACEIDLEPVSKKDWEAMQKEVKLFQRNRRHSNTITCIHKQLTKIMETSPKSDDARLLYNLLRAALDAAYNPN
jgi:hypothetical protein